MKIRIEWAPEFIMAAALFWMIIIGAHMGIITADSHSQAAERRGDAASEDTGGNKDGNKKEKGMKALPGEYKIEDFEIILQTPELPTGCEITALTMVLNYYGMNADKIQMAEKYLPSAPAEFYEGSDSLLYGPDLNQYFVGDPALSNGYICGTKAICTAADRYFLKEKKPLRAADETGVSEEELYRLVSEDTPVIVWVTINMEERREPEGWYTKEGEYVSWASNDHGAVLIGYTEASVLIADPIGGMMEYDKKAFEEVFESRGRQCVLLQEQSK
ncbi:MAG: C39 family peptidase [Lachnospiraceae bacterium]